MLSQGQPVRILVVDDEEIMLKLACDALRTQGHLVSGASGAHEALDKLRREEFDFILTDIKMPEMDGMELIQAAHDINPSLGAIFMTGYASLDTAKRAIQEGAYDYILKPFDLQEIRSAVARAVQKKSQSLEDGRSQGLSQLFDLNRILHAAGDSMSLLKLSLEFALMQTKLKSGIILYWDVRSKVLKMLQAKDLQRGSYVESSLSIDEDAVAEWSRVKEISQIKNAQEYPLLKWLAGLVPEPSLVKDFIDAKARLILIPLRKAESSSGIMVLKKGAGDASLSEEDLKLLAILGVQTAISLENLALLIETKKSYRELQNLQDQLIGLEKMATQGRISAEIGHELNNFLTVIMGNFQILSMKLDKGDLESLGKQLDTISANLEKVKKFAEGLLDFSTLKVEKAQCDINHLIEKTLTFVKPQNSFRNISFLTELKPSLPPLTVDAGQMQQVLYNLLNNAADAMGKRKGEGGTITVKTDYHQEDGCVEIHLKDTGKGMSEDELKNIFRTGFTTKESGHGIGLCICKRIIDHHGGVIRVESELNKGTTFKIELPLK
jgi:signal transduction histidine kinase/CheY-like chemotaxis protein